MNPFTALVFLVLMALSNAWAVHHVPSCRSGNERLSVSAGFASDDSWKTNETRSQKQMRSLWEKMPHTIATSHVRRMISSQISVLNSTSTTNGTTTDEVISLIPFELKTLSGVEPAYRTFYKGTFPTADCRTKIFQPLENRKKISYRLDFAYDGTQFSGWQRQKDAKLVTVQEWVEEYLCLLTGEGRVDVRVAGRTDSGVHAVGQVGRVRLLQPLMQRGIRMDNLCIWSISEVSSDFHPSFSSKNRSYAYVIDASALDDLLRQDISDQVFGMNSNGEQDDLLQLVERINYLLEPLVGVELDYFAFSYGRVKTETTVCSLSHACARLVRFQSKNHDEFSNFAVAIELTGNRFLRRMVRILVATAVQFALFPNDHKATLLEIILSRDRSQTSSPAPSAGLVFIGADCELQVS